jgi:hypothetical protein
VQLLRPKGPCWVGQRDCQAEICDDRAGSSREVVAAAGEKRLESVGVFADSVRFGLERGRELVHPALRLGDAGPPGEVLVKRFAGA